MKEKISLTFIPQLITGDYMSESYIASSKFDLTQLETSGNSNKRIPRACHNKREGSFQKYDHDSYNGYKFKQINYYLPSRKVFAFNDL